MGDHGFNYYLNNRGAQKLILIIPEVRINSRNLRKNVCKTFLIVKESSKVGKKGCLGIKRNA